MLKLKGFEIRDQQHIVIIFYYIKKIKGNKQIKNKKKSKKKEDMKF